MDSITGFFEKILEFIVNNLDGPIWNVAIVMLLGVGIFLTLSTGVIQLRLFVQSIKEMLNGRSVTGSSLTPFQAFTTGLASRVGIGNIGGVATAIAIGGAGAVFWMWVTALIGMASALAESSLAQLYKRKETNGMFRGGPAYYILYGIKSKALAVAFAIALIFTFGFAFNAVQANAIAEATHNAWGWNAHYVGFALVVITALIISGGLKRVGKISSTLVPTMAFFYLIIAAIIFFMNIEKVPSIIHLIVSSAFDFSAVAGGFFGSLVSKAMLMGIKRGLFSNEAGMGSAPNIAATSDATHPVKQGLIQMLGVFVDTIVICTCTAVIILTSDNFGSADLQGVALTQKALSYHLGQFGIHFLAIILFLFAFSSIVGNYAYAENNIKFLNSNNKVLIAFRLLVVFFVYYGAVGSGSIVWSFADTVMAIMAIINLFALVVLYPTIKLLIQDYLKQYKNSDPVFDIKNYPELLKKGVEPEIWTNSENK